MWPICDQVIHHSRASNSLTNASGSDDATAHSRVSVDIWTSSDLFSAFAQIKWECSHGITDGMCKGLAQGIDQTYFFESKLWWGPIICRFWNLLILVYQNQFILEFLSKPMSTMIYGHSSKHTGEHKAAVRLRCAHHWVESGISLFIKCMNSILDNFSFEEQVQTAYPCFARVPV